MDNHPIPQDITGFQFKLIGNMTVKQFAYLAAGVILAWITLALPITLALRMPMALFFALIGVGFAFIPIEGRPLDIMISNFIKALSTPTQYVYQKLGVNLYFPEQKLVKQTIQTTNTPNQSAHSDDKLKRFLSSLPTKSKNELDKKESVFLQNLPSFSIPSLRQNMNSAGSTLDGSNIPQNITVQQPIKADEPVNNNDELQKETEALKAQLEAAKQQEASKTSNAKEQQEAHQKVKALEDLLNEAVNQKQKLQNQLLELQTRLEQQNKQVFSPSVAQPIQQVQQTKRARSIPKEMGKSVGLPVAPEFPNIITGIVKDPRGNPLPGILVEVKDNEGNPIRAFKTTPIGQFASATPLANGSYTVDFEDPAKKNRFDTIGFDATGEIILPIEVISVDEREELRKTLFGA